MKYNWPKVSHIFNIVGILILMFTLSSCVIISSAKRVEGFFLAGQELERSGYYDAAVEKYKIALKEFGKPGVSLGVRQAIDEHFPALVNSRIAGCYAKRVEAIFLIAESSHRSGYYDAAIKKYKVALEEFEKPEVTPGIRPHIDENFPTLVKLRIAECYVKPAENFFLAAFFCFDTQWRGIVPFRRLRCGDRKI